MEELLERLERQEREAEMRAHELDMARARTDRLRSDVESRATTLEEAERTAEDRARDDARKLLMEARGEVEDAIRRLQEAVDQGRPLDEAATEARRAVEGAAARHKARRRGRSTHLGADGVAEGDRVRVHATGARGRLVEVRSDRALVEVGSMRLEVAVSDLERIDESAPSAEAGRAGGGWSGPPTGDVRIEVDLRGMRVDEMELELQRALDHAVIEDLGQLRIIHGKGTGALRKRVGEILKADSRVSESRMGGPTEGGAGVTVAKFGGAR